MKGTWYNIEYLVANIMLRGDHIDKNTFFTAHNIGENDLLEANMTWDELLLIEEEYRKIEKSLREIGKSFIDEWSWCWG